MMPPRSAQARICRTISLTASRLVFDDGVFQAHGAASDKFAGIDVNGHQRFGMIDDDVAAGLEPDLRAQGLVQLLLDAELLEDGRGLGVELDAADQLGLEAADKLDDLAVFPPGLSIQMAV